MTLQNRQIVEITAQNICFQFGSLMPVRTINASAPDDRIIQYEWRFIHYNKIECGCVKQLPQLQFQFELLLK